LLVGGSRVSGEAVVSFRLRGGTILGGPACRERIVVAPPCASPELEAAPPAAIVGEAGHSALFKLAHVNGNWLADQLARLQARYLGV
jgi:hypothetical protein